jgi:transglutaminase-like putative cysteine protease
MARTAALSAIAAVVVAADWLRLERPRGAEGRAVVLVLVAIAPALLPRAGARLAAAVAAAFVGVSVAFSVSPLAAWPGGDAYVHPLGSRFAGAFADFYAFRLPIDPAVHARMHMLLLAAIFAFTLAVALAVAARRPVAAVALFLIGAGWPSTLLAGGHALGRGAVILLGALAILAGLTGRGGRLAVPATAGVVLVALALSASPALAKPAFLDWQHWNPYVRTPKPVSVRYVWDGSYAGVHFPRKRTTVLTIAAPATIGTYWRATVLDSYVRDRWIERLRRETPGETGALLPPAAQDSAHFVEQQVTVDGLDDSHIVGASMPVAYNLSQPTAYEGQNVVEAIDPLHRGDRYTVWSYAPTPKPAALARLAPAYPKVLTEPGRELEIVPGVDAPPFGTPGGDGRLGRRLTGHLEPYGRLLGRARAVVGNTTSPYAAVVALERWLRTTGGFTYSEQPPPTPGLPPLVGFVLQTKTGYCQHFAGAMALMARLLGIPARVAAGFVTGTYANGEWTVTDHDAHTWVEVWFPRYGWLPFDPTPGRGRLAGSYTDASLRFDPAAEARLLSGLVRGGEVFGKAGADGAPRRGRSLNPSKPTVGTRGDNRPIAGSTSHSLLRFVLLLAAGVVAAIALLKLARRRSRYLTRDPRRLAAACVRELTDFVADQRIGARPGGTLRELCGEIEERLVVDADRFADAVEAARFGPPAQAVSAAARARDELRELKRSLRRNIVMLDRARGFVSLRSLGFS